MDYATNEVVAAGPESSRRRRSLAWVAAGAAALLAGGTTFALWSAQASFSGGTIAAGDLNLVLKQDTEFYDVSNDRVDGEMVIGETDGSQPGHSIDDLGTWRMAPGDKMGASFITTATLEGDNLVGELKVDNLPSETPEDGPLFYSYEVYTGGDLLVEETALPDEHGETLLYLSAPVTGQESGKNDATAGTIGVDAEAMPGDEAHKAVFGLQKTSVDLNVIIYASFYKDMDGDFRYTDGDVTVSDRDAVQTADTLEDLTVTLSQVRDTGEQFVAAESQALGSSPVRRAGIL